MSSPWIQHSSSLSRISADRDVWMLCISLIIFTCRSLVSAYIYSYGDFPSSIEKQSLQVNGASDTLKKLNSKSVRPSQPAWCHRLQASQQIDWVLQFCRQEPQGQKADLCIETILRFLAGIILKRAYVSQPERMVTASIFHFYMETE